MHLRKSFIQYFYCKQPDNVQQAKILAVFYIRFPLTRLPFMIFWDFTACLICAFCANCRQWNNYITPVHTASAYPILPFSVHGRVESIISYWMESWLLIHRQTSVANLFWNPVGSTIGTKSWKLSTQSSYSNVWKSGQCYALTNLSAEVARQACRSLVSQLLLYYLHSRMPFTASGTSCK